ncbi:tRNA (adenine(22)-N(1))-methyltransferase [Bacillus piscicola]|uniref:tRNA (adenine(22)-N(1))-methyltransferase n=1 Tax=Bacillus piscicola TaxID=1632684 RepID=UPI001F0A01CD|nr:tRNA (adenine(22)-N(1))-methyltransferase TrmK [Bacillus piscicola]
MKENSVSRRLQMIASEVPEGARIADIGTDHGYLPLYLIKEGKVQWALASDVNQGPLNSAIAKIKENGLQQCIEARRGSGLSVIKQEDQIDTVIIAGMGGPLITTILSEGVFALEHVKRLILQPNVHALVIRKWLARNDWELIEEHIVEEEGRIYEVLVAEPGNPSHPYDSLPFAKEAGFLFGPFLIRKQSQAFIKKWEREKELWQQITTELEKASGKKDNRAKKKELEENIKLVKEVLQYGSS